MTGDTALSLLVLGEKTGAKGGAGVGGGGGTQPQPQAQDRVCPTQALLASPLPANSLSQTTQPPLLTGETEARGGAVLALLPGSELGLETGCLEAPRGPTLQTQLAVGLRARGPEGSSPRAAFSLRSSPPTEGA